MTTAIVMSGGGARGDFQLGALTALEESGIVPDIVCGTSVGALNALMLTQGPSGLDELRRIWLGLRRNDHMWLFEDWWNEIHPSIREAIIGTINGDASGASTDSWSVRSALLFGGGLGAVALGPIGFLGGALAGATVSGAIQNVTADALKDVLRILGTRAQSVFNLNPVRALMAQHFDTTRFQSWVSSGKKLRLAAVALGSGELGYFTERGELIPRHGSAPTATGISILDAAMASSSIAAVFPPVALAGDFWVDGGHRENIPLRSALQAGATRVFVICSSPIDPVSSVNRTDEGTIAPSDFRRERILGIAQRALLDMHLDELAAGDIYPVLETASIPITIIAPRYPTHDIVSIDPEFIRTNYDYGYRQAMDVLRNAPPAQREKSDRIALNAGRIARHRRRAWHQVGIPFHADINVLRAENTNLEGERQQAGLASRAPVVHETLARGQDLVPGDRMFPGQALASPEGRFRLIYQTDGNFVLYDDSSSPSRALWATGTDGQSLGVVVMQRDGNLVMYSDDVQALWASGTNGENDARLRVQSDGNVVLYIGDRTVWQTGTSVSVPGPGPGPGPTPQPVNRTGAIVNGSPMTIRARLFKLDDGVMAIALPGGEFTLTPGQRVDWTFPSDVNAAKVRINQRHELRLDPGQTVTFSTDDRLAVSNRTSRAVDAALFHDQDIVRAVALPDGRFRIEPNSTRFWEFPADIERAALVINNRNVDVVRRGSAIEYNFEDRVFVTNQTPTSASLRFYRKGDTWRWVTLPGGDFNVAPGATVEYQVPSGLDGVQVALPGTIVVAQTGDKLGFRGNGQVVNL
jgi:predicted acylesterase/phospholipase RssA